VSESFTFAIWVQLDRAVGMFITQVGGPSISYDPLRILGSIFYLATFSVKKTNAQIQTINIAGSRIRPVGPRFLRSCNNNAPLMLLLHTAEVGVSSIEIRQLLELAALTIGPKSRWARWP
jgi:hypothetical protein